MVSTPNNPGGLFERIEKESEDTCLYKRLALLYHYGLGKGKIYKSRKSKRLSNLQGLKGNTISSI